MPKTLVLIPTLLAGGFVILGSSMGMVLFAAVQVAQRSLNYGMLGPKNFIDTVVYRGSDVTASWIFKGMTSAGLSIAQIAWVYVPVLGLWAFGAWRLGRIYMYLKDKAAVSG